MCSSAATRPWNVVALLLVMACLSGVEAHAAADELSVDPTMPLFFEGDPAQRDGSTPAAAGYVLNSILTRNNQRVAVINSQRVRVGDAIGAALVTAIGETTVTLDIAGRTQVLQLYKAAIRTPAGDG